MFGRKTRKLLQELKDNQDQLAHLIEHNTNGINHIVVAIETLFNDNDREEFTKRMKENLTHKQQTTLSFREVKTEVEKKLQKCLNQRKVKAKENNGVDDEYIDVVTKVTYVYRLLREHYGIPYHAHSPKEKEVFRRDIVAKAVERDLNLGANFEKDPTIASRANWFAFEKVYDRARPIYRTYKVQGMLAIGLSLAHDKGIKVEF